MTTYLNDTKAELDRAIADYQEADRRYRVVSSLPHMGSKYAQMALRAYDKVEQLTGRVTILERRAVEDGTQP